MLLATLSIWQTTSLAAPARADEPPCRKDGDRVSCSADGFKVLTDLVVQHRSRADKCELQLKDAQADTADMTTALHACQAALAAVPPPKPPPSATKPLLGYAAGVVGTMALVVALAVDMPPTARAVVGATGIAGLGVGVVLVVP